MPSQGIMGKFAKMATLALLVVILAVALNRMASVATGEDTSYLISWSATRNPYAKPAKNLVRPMPMGLDPRKTWAMFLRNADRTDREEAQKKKKELQKCRRIVKAHKAKKAAKRRRMSSELDL